MRVSTLKIFFVVSDETKAKVETDAGKSLDPEDLFWRLPQTEMDVDAGGRVGPGDLRRRLR